MGFAIFGGDKACGGQRSEVRGQLNKSPCKYKKM